MRAKVKIMLALAVVVSMIGFFTGCATTRHNTALAGSAFALDLPANKLVDAKWLKKNMSDKSLVIIDIRAGADLYKKSHIPGAIAWNTGDFRETRFNDIPGYLPSPKAFTELMKKSGITKDSKVIFYSDGKNPASYTIAGLGVYVTEYYGFKNTSVLNGGLAAWEKEGFKTDNKDVYRIASDWIITDMNLENYASISNVDSAIELKTAQIVDARGDAQFNGSESHPLVLKKGHVAGAKHLFVGNFTKKTGEVVYLDAAGAKAQFAKANVDTSKPIIWMCNTSWDASGGWFAGKYLGGVTDAKVYDGSLVEYVKTPNRDLVKGNK